MLDRTPKPPDAKARHRLRQRRHRERQRQNRAVAPVCFNGSVLSGLINAGWLREQDADNRALVGAAIERMIAEAFRGD